MKILHVSTSDMSGGAAKAAYRLHRSLLNNNIDSTMLVQNKISDDFTVLDPNTKIQKILAYLGRKIDALPLRKYPGRQKTLFSPAIVPFSNIVQRINELAPDIVHLHWVSFGMIRIEDIEKINAWFTRRAEGLIR